MHLCPNFIGSMSRGVDWKEFISLLKLHSVSGSTYTLIEPKLHPVTTMFLAELLLGIFFPHYTTSGRLWFKANAHSIWWLLPEVQITWNWFHEHENEFTRVHQISIQQSTLGMWTRDSHHKLRKATQPALYAPSLVYPSITPCCFNPSPPPPSTPRLHHSSLPNLQCNILVGNDKQTSPWSRQADVWVVEGS